MTIVDLEQMPPDDRAAIQAMVEAAYRKAPELRVKLNDEASSNAAHWHKVAMECRAEIDRLHVENAKLAKEAKRLQGLLDAVHQIAGELARPSGI
jgi:diadenosine tetraphosphate (Ap4A) HIT family hydrolase